MRPMLLILLASAAALAQDELTPPQQTTEAKDSPLTIHGPPWPGAAWRIHWQFQVIALPAKQAFALLPELRDETASEAAWGKLQGMVEKAEAEVVVDTGGQSRSGGECRSFLGTTLSKPDNTNSARVVDSVLAQREAERQGTEPKYPVTYGAWSFQSRKLGHSLVFTPTAMPDGKTLNVALEFERTWFEKWEEHEIARMANGEKLFIKEPRLATVSAKETSVVASGERILLSAHRIPGDSGKMELASLRIRTAPIPGRVAPPPSKDIPRPNKAEAPGAKAEDWKGHWKMDVVALSARHAQALLPELRDENTQAAGWAKLQELIEKNEAQVAFPLGGRFQHDGVVEAMQGEEVWNPHDQQHWPALLQTRDYRTVQKARAGDAASVGFGTYEFFPFKVGVALVLKAVVSDDGQTFRVFAKMDRTWPAEWEKFEIGIMANGERIETKTRRLLHATNQGNYGLRAGERVLLNAHRIAGDENRMELVFLQLRTTPKTGVEK